MGALALVITFGLLAFVVGGAIWFWTVGVEYLIDYFEERKSRRNKRF